MLVRQLTLTDPARALASLRDLAEPAPQWILVFASPSWFRDPQFFPMLRQAFPTGRLSGCSTAGEIGQRGVTSGTCVVTTLAWSGPMPAQAIAELDSMEDSLATGLKLGRDLPPSAGVLVLAPGVNVDGNALVEGLSSGLPGGTRIVGGLAGDDGQFVETYTLSDAGVSSRAVVALALPPGLRIGHGSFGGWKAFGPARKITRSAGNILYELDGEPALTVYKRELGDHARNLPGAGMLFPFELLGADPNAMGLIRTVVGIDERSGSLTLAGAVDPEAYLKLMTADTDALVDGARTAAAATRATLAADPEAGLAILVSCVGRRLVLGNRVGEEVEAVSSVLGHGVTVTGFYSYGQISPFFPGHECRLHNQTMTVSCLAEF